MEVNTTKNIVIGLLEIPKPMLTMGVSVPMLDLAPKYFSGSRNYWRKREITEKQVSYMKSFGILVTPNDRLKFKQGTASDILDALIKRPTNQERITYHLIQASKLLEVSRY